MSNCYIWNPSSGFCSNFNNTYSFSGANNRTYWPKHRGTFLGAAGAYNFLLPVGIRYASLVLEELSIISKYDFGRIFERTFISFVKLLG